MRYFTWKLELVSNIFWIVVGKKNFLLFPYLNLKVYRRYNKTCFFKNYIFRSIFNYSQLFLSFFFLVHLKNTFKTTLSSRTTVTSKMEHFVAISESFHFLATFTKSSVLDVEGVIDPTLITDIFRFTELDLNQSEINSSWI